MSNRKSEQIKQLGLLPAILSLGYVFWVLGGMEMIERFAYYGVKAVAALYAKDPVSKGGLGITMSEFGNIMLVWALVQSALPIITGAITDRIGYKKTIAISTVVKILGYLIMGVFVSNFVGFFVGAVVLAAGTAIFKPGIQGTLAKVTVPENQSVAWGVFYQTVNIGGFLGPILAGTMRKMAWEYVFFACAAIISINFILLLVYKDPGEEERKKREAMRKAGELEEQKDLLQESLTELKDPVLYIYLGLFSGFWFMFNALFDVLPVFIDEWTDTRAVVLWINDLFENGLPWLLSKLLVLTKDGTEFKPEGLLNINAGVIMLTCFLFSWLSGKLRATSSMVIGTLLATTSLFLIGQATAGWTMVLVIMLFSIGEMLSSPKFSEFVAAIAPDDKKAMYLGFSQIPFAIGWTLEGKIGPWLYEQFASKEAIAREYLSSKMGMTAEAVAKIPEGEAFDKATALSGIPKWELTSQFAAANDISGVWIIMGCIGLASAVGIWIYGRWLVNVKKIHV